MDSPTRDLSPAPEQAPDLSLEVHRAAADHLMDRARSLRAAGRSGEAEGLARAALHHQAAGHHAAAAGHHAAAARHIVDALDSAPPRSSPASSLGAPSDEAERFVTAALQDSSLLIAYARAAADGRQAEFLAERGVRVAPDELGQAFLRLRGRHVQLWAGVYVNTSLYADGRYAPAPYLIVGDDGRVDLGGEELRALRYRDNILSWRSEDGNPASGRVSFQARTDEDGEVSSTFSGALQFPDEARPSAFEGSTEPFSRVADEFLESPRGGAAGA